LRVRREEKVNYSFYIKIVPIIAMLNFCFASIIYYSFGRFLFQEMVHIAVAIMIGGSLCACLINIVIAFIAKKKYGDHFTIISYFVFVFAIPFAFPFFLDWLSSILRNFLSWHFQEFIMV